MILMVSSETSASCIARLPGVRFGMARRSLRLPEFLAGLLALEELGGQGLGGARAEGLLDEPAGVAALAAGEPPGLDLGLALGADGDLDGLQAAPPTLIVSLI